jgi:hypothetical protein
MYHCNYCQEVHEGYPSADGKCHIEHRDDWDKATLKHRGEAYRALINAHINAHRKVVFCPKCFIPNYEGTKCNHKTSNVHLAQDI